MALEFSFQDDDGDLAVYCGSAMTFTTSDAFTLYEVRVKIGDGTGAPSVIVNVDLYAVDGESKPTGASLYSIGSINQDALVFPPVWVVFSGLSYSMQASTEYALVCDVDNKDETSNFTWSYGNASYTGSHWKRTYVIGVGCDPWSTFVNKWDFLVYSLDAPPGKPTTPSPSDAASDITLDETPLSWVDGGNTDTYEIYFREQGDGWDLVGVAQAGVSWAVSFGTLAYGTTYEWRIDATNTTGTTTGDTWSFETISFDQLRISYRLIGGGNGQGPYDDPPGVQGTDWEWTGENNMLTVKKLVVAANNKIWHEDI